VVVPAELSDVVINYIIAMYKPVLDQDDIIKNISITKTWNKNELKKIDINLLLRIIKYDSKIEQIPTKIECLKRIINNKGLVLDYYGYQEDEQHFINTEK
jgi:hypothetical protein